MANTLNPNLIDEIIAEVLSTLRERSRFTSMPKPTPNSPQPQQRLEREAAVELLESVITGEMLAKLGNHAKAIRVLPSAILTPTARDYLRANGIRVIKGEQQPHSTSESVGGKSKIIASSLPPVVQTLLSDIRRNKHTHWSVEIESGMDQVVERTRSVIYRGEASQVLVFARLPYQLVCKVNRTRSCRAVLVSNGDNVRQARAECGANVICVNLLQPTFIGLREIVRVCQETAEETQSPCWSSI